MNQREKVLLYSVGGLAGLLVLFFGLRLVVLKPVRAKEKEIAALKLRLSTIQKDRRNYFLDEEKMKAYAQRSFADNLDQASAQSGEMLTRLIIQSGLAEDEFTRLPVGPNKKKGASEIGWSIQGDGKLNSVVNLLFLLQQLPRVHRIEGLNLSTGDKPGEVKVRFRYLTLVLDPAPAVTPVGLIPKFALGTPERNQFDAIITRDVLRPYIKRPPPPPSPPGPATPPGPAAPGPENFRLVDLSEWLGQPEIAVLDKAAQKVTRYKPGDPLADGVIVMVDYRPLPLPDKPGLVSNSRVIIRIGNEYWAVERGRTLADKYKLTAEQLPENLTRL